MKQPQRLLLALLALLLLPNLSRAEALDLSKLPPLKQGLAFSLADSKLNYLSTLEVAKWDKFKLEAGYAGQAKETGDKAVAVLSYDLFKADKYIQWPIVKYVTFSPGLYVGLGRITGSNEFDYGISATVLDIKF